MALFAKRAAIRRTCHIFKKRRNPGITAALYKTAHCGVAVKVWRTRWEKSGAHGATFSSAAAVRLFFILFDIYCISTSVNCILMLC